ncbi:DUF1934 family protein [Mammaliicoccus sciuri]
MKENININIKQVVKQNGEKETFQTKTSGTFHRRNSDIIRYEETIDEQIVKNMLKIEDDGVKSTVLARSKQSFTLLKDKKRLVIMILKQDA